MLEHTHLPHDVVEERHDADAAQAVPLLQLGEHLGLEVVPALGGDEAAHHAELVPVHHLLGLAAGLAARGQGRPAGVAVQHHPQLLQRVL